MATFTPERQSPEKWRASAEQWANRFASADKKPERSLLMCMLCLVCAERVEQGEPYPVDFYTAYELIRTLEDS